MNALQPFLAGLIALTASVVVPGTPAQFGAYICIDLVEWPNTRAGRWGQLFLLAYNAEGDNALREFIKSHYSEAALNETTLDLELADFLLLRRAVGRITAYSASADGDIKVDALAKADNVGWVKLRFELSPAPPHDAIRVGIVGFASPPAATTSVDYRLWSDLRVLVKSLGITAASPFLQKLRHACSEQAAHEHTNTGHEQAAPSAPE
jgi:hypothetical protein